MESLVLFSILFGIETLFVLDPIGNPRFMNQKIISFFVIQKRMVSSSLRWYILPL